MYPIRKKVFAYRTINMRYRIFNRFTLNIFIYFIAFNVVCEVKNRRFSENRLLTRKIKCKTRVF